MKRKIYSFLLSVSFALPSLGVAGDIQILYPKVENLKGIAEARVSQVPADDISFSIAEPGSKQTVRASSNTIATNLWILVDSSTLCQAQKVDNSINQMVHALKRYANPQTLLTLVAYTSESVDYLARRKALAELDDVQVQCERRPFSISYDQPLAKLLSEDSDGQLPVVVWVFTAGNIDLTKATASQLVRRNAELSLVLYNEFVEKEIQPAVQTTSSLLRGQSFHFGLQAKAETGLFFPSMRYEIEFPVQRKWQGKELLQISTKTDSANAPFAKNDFAVNVPADTSFWGLYGRRILFILFLVGLVYSVYRLVDYYRPKFCAECQRRLSFKSRACLFCVGASKGVLMGDFRNRSSGFGNSLSGKRMEILPLVDAVTELGSHRRSPVRFPKRKRPECFAKLIREESPSGQVLFQLVREPSSLVDLEVNGQVVKRNRYLATGDEIRIDSTPLSFFFEEQKL